MAIKRLQRTEGSPRFPEIGKLRKGGERPESGKAPGKDLDHFRFTSDDDRAVQMFEAAYGKTPAAINVYLPMPTTDENFSAWQEKWVAGGLQHRCDGETCTIWLKPDGTYSQEPKPCPGGCKEVGRLMVIIPELQRMAYVTAETHSVNDIITITDNLNAIEHVAGTLTGIPFILKRVPREISTPSGGGKRARRLKWMLSIEVDPVWAAIRFDTMHRQALATVSEDHPMLVDSIHGDDGEYIGVVSEIDDEESAFIDSLDDAPEDTAASVAAPPKFKNIDDAKKYAIDLGVYDADTVGDAYSELKAKVKPGSAGEMWANWIAHCVAQLPPAE